MNEIVLHEDISSSYLPDNSFLAWTVADVRRLIARYCRFSLDAGCFPGPEGTRFWIETSIECLVAARPDCSRRLFLRQTDCAGVSCEVKKDVEGPQVFGLSMAVDRHRQWGSPAWRILGPLGITPEDFDILRDFVQCTAPRDREWAKLITALLTRPLLSRGYFVVDTANLPRK